MINPAPRPMHPRPPVSIELFSSGPPSRPHVDVAYLEAEQETNLSFDDTEQFFTLLRDRAASMGCDGVVIGGVTHSADVLASVAANIHASRKGLTATCIVYTSERQR